jgi:hypothetical protein
LAMLVLAGCGETNIQAIHRLAPWGHTVRQRLRTIAERLPPMNSLSPRPFPTGISPPPVYDDTFLSAKGKLVSNTEIMLVEHMKNPEADVRGARRFDPQLSGWLHDCVRWTGPKNPLDPSVWDTRGRIGKECTEAFRYPYLVALRIDERGLPEDVRVEGTLIDLRREEMLGAFVTTVRFRYVDESDPSHSIYVPIRCAIQRELQTVPGGTFRIEERCPKVAELAGE